MGVSQDCLARSIDFGSNFSRRPKATGSGAGRRASLDFIIRLICSLKTNGSKRFMNQVAILAVNYNTRCLTEGCLNCIQQNLDVSKVDVVVVDNQSTDGSAEYLRSLDWIRLIERKVEAREAGKTAHARGLDAGIAHIDTPYLLCIHTDTFLYNAKILDVLLEPVLKDPSVVCVGSTEQVHRGLLRRVWRKIKRSTKNMLRGVGRAVGLKVKLPRRENQYVRSYCTLWNLDVIKEKKLSFHAPATQTTPGNDSPGYLMQDLLEDAGYRIVKLPTRKIFKHVDHVHRGTIVGTGGLHGEHRRSRKYKHVLGSKSQ